MSAVSMLSSRYRKQNVQTGVSLNLTISLKANLTILSRAEAALIARCNKSTQI